MRIEAEAPFLVPKSLLKRALVNLKPTRASFPGRCKYFLCVLVDLEEDDSIVESSLETITYDLHQVIEDTVVCTT